MARWPSAKTKPARSAPPHVRRYSSEILANLAKRTNYVDPRLAADWSQIVGASSASLCRPGRLLGGRRHAVLEIHAINSAAAARLQFDEERLRQAVNAFLGPETVARLSIKHSQSAGGQPTEKSAQPHHPKTTGKTTPMGLSRFRKG